MRCNLSASHETVEEVGGDKIATIGRHTKFVVKAPRDGYAGRDWNAARLKMFQRERACPDEYHAICRGG